MVAEVALALVLVLGAGLLIKSFYQLSRVDPGFDGADVVKLYLMPSGTVYADAPEKKVL